LGPDFTPDLYLHLSQVCIHANLKSLTVEELKGQKRDMHLTAFRYMLAETARELKDTAGEQRARDRLQRDPFRENQGVTHTLEGLVAKILGECDAVLERHAAITPDRYAAHKFTRPDSLNSSG
jgi:hypothetical protein